MNNQDLGFTQSLRNSLTLIENALEFAQSKGVFKLKDASEITSALIEVDVALKSFIENKNRTEKTDQTLNKEDLSMTLPLDAVEDKFSDEKPKPTRRRNG